MAWSTGSPWSISDPAAPSSTGISPRCTSATRRWFSFLEGEIANAQLTHQRSPVARVASRAASAPRRGACESSLAPARGCCAAFGRDAADRGRPRAADKPLALRALADAVDKQQQMWRLMLASSALPALTIPICYALIAVLGKVILVIDDATPIYARDALWEGLNGWARDIAVFAQSWGPQAVVALAVCLCALLGSLPRWRGSARLRVDAWPVYGLYRDFQAGMLFSAMAMLLKTGETLQGSIDDVAQRASPWLRWHLGRVADALEENPTATLDAFRRGLLSPHLLSARCPRSIVPARRSRTC